MRIAACRALAFHLFLCGGAIAPAVAATTSFLKQGGSAGSLIGEFDETVTFSWDGAERVGERAAERGVEAGAAAVAHGDDAAGERQLDNLVDDVGGEVEEIAIVLGIDQCLAGLCLPASLIIRAGAELLHVVLESPVPGEPDDGQVRSLVMNHAGSRAGGVGEARVSPGNP